MVVLLELAARAINCANEELRGLIKCMSSMNSNYNGQDCVAAAERMIIFRW